MNQREFAKALGATAHNYWAIRLRDEKSFTLDVFEEDPSEFIAKAWDNHSERIWNELVNLPESPAVVADLDQRRPAKVTPQPVKKAARKGRNQK